MGTTILVVSDLHLADGTPQLENWGPAQQQAFARMLRLAAPGGALAGDTVELVINGDCFDFLLAQPSLEDRDVTDVNVAHAKWLGILNAHGDFFSALNAFLRMPSYRVTFLIGNHDLELLYPSIRARVRSAIGAPPGMVRFCLTRVYQPVPDVVVEHGCQFDPYNAIPALWDRAPLLSTPAQLETGDPRGVAVGPAPLPWGSRYFYRVFRPAKQQLRYLDEFIPSLSFIPQSALLSLLAPNLVPQIVAKLAALNPAATNLQALPLGPDHSPADLFASTMMMAQHITASTAQRSGSGEIPPEVSRLYAVLQGDRVDALREILCLTPENDQRLDRDTRAGGMAFLAEYPETRFMILGHTHEEGRWKARDGQWEMNTGTWFPRHARPHPENWTPEYAAWAMHPADQPYPGPDGARFIAAWVRVETGAASVAELIRFQGDGFALVPDDAMDRW